MAEYVRITDLRGPKGDTGVVGAATVTMIPAGEQPSAPIRVSGGVTVVDFFIPRGLPGVNAVPADNAVATYSTAQGSATNTALRSFLVSKGQTIIGAIGAPFMDFEGNTGSAATAHFTNGPGFSAPYIVGIGNNWGTKPGLLLSNYDAGQALYIDNHPSSTGTAVFGAQRSNASLFDLVQAKDGAGTLMVVRVDNGITNPGSLAAFYASTGESLNIRGTGDVDVRQRLRVLGNDGGPAAEILVQSAPATPSSQANGAWLSQNAHTFVAASGSDGAFFKTRIAAVGDRLRLQAGGGGGFSASAPSWSDIVAITSDSKLGFFGATPVARPNVTNDIASVRAALSLLGLVNLV